MVDPQVGQRAMTKLATLNRKLEGLRSRRQTARTLTAAAAVVLGLVWFLLGIFFIDWLFQMTIGQRVVTILLSAAGMVWVYLRYAIPFLGRSESLTEVALLVERHFDIDSDLVAALQFDLPRSETWGSRELQTAVIDYVDEFSRGWELKLGVPRKQMQSRLIAAGVNVLFLAVVMLLSPSVTAAFLNRLALGSAHYPTDTIIQTVLVNGEPVDVSPSFANRIVVKAAFGKPVEFKLICSGELPSDAEIGTNLIDSGETGAIRLKRNEQEQDTYQGKLPELLGTIEFSITAGDAWTEPVQIEVIPLPIVELKLKPTMPEYVVAAGFQQRKADPSSWQISVFEGSRVDLEIVCHNKSLSEAVLIVENKKYPLKRADESGQRWLLPVDDTPLAAVNKPLSFDLAVLDEDNLAPETLIRGKIRLEPDRTPRIQADVALSREVFVLPSASPRIRYLVDDDFGISDVIMHVHVNPQSAKGRKDKFSVWNKKEPKLAKALPEKNVFQFDLREFSLSKGDVVQITLEAFDFRGNIPGHSTTSEPITLVVTDRAGAVAAFTNAADVESERLLQRILERATRMERQ